MKKNVLENKLYELIPSQNAMYLMYKFGIHKQQAQIPTSVMIERELDFNLLQRAFRIEIERNDSLRLRFIKEKGNVRQYFTGSFDYRVPVRYFFSEAEQEKFFSADASRPVRFLNTEPYRIWFFRTAHKGTGIYSNFSHLVTDAAGIVIFYLDLLNIYDALEQHSELPKALDRYEDYIIKRLAEDKNEKKNAKHEAFYREYFSRGGAPFYAAVHGPELLEKFRSKTGKPDARVPMAYNPLFDKCDMLTFDVSKEDTEQIVDFCMEKQISPESVFQAGLRTYCSAINYKTEDVSFMTVCANRSGVKEKNMSGCMAQPLILRTVLSEDSTFMDVVERITYTRLELYRHSLYPYTKARDMFLDIHNLGPIQGANSMMFSWIPLPTGETMPFRADFRTYNLRSYFTPLYTIVCPDMITGGIRIYYMYRTKYSSSAQIERLHGNTMKVIMEGIKDPDRKISRFYDDILKNDN